MVADGLMAELTDRGVPYIELSPDSDFALQVMADPDIATLVVVQGPSRVGGKRLDRYVSAEAKRLPASSAEEIAADVRRFARSQRPLRLVGPGAEHLFSVLDGTSEAVCVPRYREQPDLLLDLAPSVVADLYSQGQVSSPPLAPELLQPLATWSDAFPIELLLAPARTAGPAPTGGAPGPDAGLVLSRSNC